MASVDVANAIGSVLKERAALDPLVRDSTGEYLEHFAAPSVPIKQAALLVLQSLEKDGTEHWFLNSVLAEAMSNAGLRRMIVTNYPKTLTTLPKIDDMVGSARDRLQKIIAIALHPDYRADLVNQTEKLLAISTQISQLNVYKTLHESLHGLHLRLAYQSGSPVPDAANTTVDPKAAIATLIVTAARVASTLEITLRSDEDDWIAWLGGWIQKSPSAAGGNVDAVWLENVQRFVRLHLARLNMRIFDSARTLSLQELLDTLPVDLKQKEEVIGLNFAVRELKAAVIARAILHKIWQDAENELPIIMAFLDAAPGEHRPIGEHWLSLHARLRALSAYDTDTASQIGASLKEVDSKVTQEQPYEAIRPSFKVLDRLCKFRFFAVDADLKKDCTTLHQFNAPLTQYVGRLKDG